MDKKIKIGTIFLIATWLFTGIYADDEFGEHSMFLKYRPTFQYYFKSPLGMQDMPASFPLKLAVEQATYDEFINQKHWSDNDFLATTFCGVLYLGTIYLMISGLLKQFKYEK
ncbi:hypothetical protein [Pedobacter sp. SL55]|uniref:hypothetical protein n=1 Tax=Pedobacter sp. SL55 TaxID=2995161 RepID=UPI0022718ACD|nr:hypothetical protein [Pedobacter sp. SL55]WAC42571.1 hypothetical protein OVA16_09515 [Pedobacter sp. SL55]